MDKKRDNRGHRYRRLPRAVQCSAGWLLAVLVMAAPACGKGAARTISSLPELDVPAPPPRLVLPIQVEVEEPDPVQTAEEPAPPQPAPARPRAAAPTEVPRPAAEEPVRPAGPNPPPAVQPPATTLQTTATAEQGEVERGIRATMVRATTELNRIDYQALNADARSQYDTAKRFVQQADDAIRSKNLPFAKNLADKAAVLAAQLGGQ